MEESSKDLLAGIIEEQHFVRASTGKRLANFLIDYIVYIFLFVVICLVWLLISPETFDRMGTENDFSFNLAGLFLYAVYMGAVEAITKGSSMGKLITGTRALQQGGSIISTATAFKRGFTRIIPFEVLSGLATPCYPWHDKWTRSMVIDVKKSSL